jgi:hypothetical protein
VVYRTENDSLFDKPHIREKDLQKKSDAKMEELEQNFWSMPAGNALLAV